MERIEPEAVAVGVLHEEVAGQADAVHRNTEPARNLDDDHRQRDRNAALARQHGVEERVLRILVMRRVTAEVVLFEQHVPDFVERRQPRLTREVVEPAAPLVDVESLARVRGDAQRRLVEMDRRPVRRNDVREPFRRILHAPERTRGPDRPVDSAACVAPPTSCARPSDAGSVDISSASHQCASTSSTCSRHRIAR